MLKKFHFYRFEIKYKVLEKYKPFIRKSLLAYMNWDNYALLNKNKKYWVNSIYFDSPTLKSYWEKDAGIKNRFKLRLRCYNMHGFVKTDNIFFEIKRKKDATVIKDRGLINSSLYGMLIKSGGLSKLINNKQIKKMPVFRDFLFLKTRYLMEPKINVLYEREPLEAANYSNLRITFDSNIMACRASKFCFNDSFKKISNNFFIMEVKFQGILPYWFHNLVQKYSLKRIAFSKYCSAVEKCYNWSYGTTNI